MNRKYALAIAALSALLLGDPCFAQAPSQADSLEGLWKAKRWFGHFDKSRLIIQRTGKIYTADMLGRTLPVRVEKDDLTFVWPGERGRFRGRLDAGGIRGHWIRLGGKGGVASPVFLAPRGTDRWMGDVEAGRTEFTFYLLLKKRPDGSFAALLGNPERDMGSQFGVNRLTREGNVVRLFAKRNAQAEERELSSGTFDPENETITLSFPSRGGSFDFKREGDDSEFYPRGKNPGSYTYTLPPALGDGWITATPEQVSIDRKGLENTVQVLLNAPMDSVGTPKVHALLVARHGKLILEEYFHGENRERIHQLYSGGKSITSMIIGAAMYEGTPLKLSSRVYEVMNGGTMPADVDPRKRAMTLENLMTMSPGYFCDDEQHFVDSVSQDRACR